MFEFSLYGRDSTNSAGKIRQIFKPFKNAISSMKDSQVSLKMSMKNLLVKKGLDASLAQSKGSLAPSNHGNYSFAPLASTRIRVATEKKKNNYSEMLVQLEDDEEKVVANLWLDINLIPAVSLKIFLYSYR